jgi:uncharacterized membrane protein
LKKHFLPLLKDLGIYLLLCLATFLMAKTIAQYFALDDHVAFLKVKQDYIQLPIWKAAFYCHVFSSIFTLVAGFFQFSSFILTRHRNVHRLIGRMYAWNIFLINFPAGFIMAVYANGHLPSKIAFVILDCLWFAFTLKAVAEARKKNIAQHKNFMIRSYALTCSAVTLRTWKLILSNIFNIEPGTLYMIDAWLGFVPNLLFAEWLINKRKIDFPLNDPDSLGKERPS